MRLLGFVILGLLLPFSTLSQNMRDGKMRSKHTYIYRLDSSLARELYHKQMVFDTVDYYQNFVTRHHSDSVFDYTSLGIGHYLIVNAVGTSVVFKTHENPYFHFRTAGYNKEARVFISDHNGKVLEDAVVHLKKKQYTFQEDCGCYPIPHRELTGFAKITHKEHFTFQHLSSKKPPSNDYRNTRNKYRNKLFSTTRILPGYLVFNQPKYRLGDTVKMKAYLVKEKGNPWKKKAKIYLKNYQNNKKTLLTKKLKPVTPGAYVYEFVVPDTLEVDRNYEVQIYSGKKQIKSNNIIVEDYELKNNVYSLKMPRLHFYKGESVPLHLSATDANGLPLMDAYAHIQVTASSVQKAALDTFFMPHAWYNSFYEKKIPLDVSGETVFELPDSLFPLATIKYNVKVSINNSDNEPQTFNKTFTKEANYENFQLWLDGDTVRANYKYNDIDSKDCDAWLTTYYNGKEIEKKKITFPYQEVLNYACTEYKLTNEQDELLGRSLYTPYRLNDLIKMEGYRTHDSIKIDLVNEVQIPVHWQMYKGKTKVEGGRGKTLHFEAADGSLDSYRVLFGYQWHSDVVCEKGFHIREKELTVEIDQPKDVFPGEQVPIDIKVTDYRKKPVKDVNLTAWSVNEQFDHIPMPEMPYFGRNHYDLLRPFAVYNSAPSLNQNKPIIKKYIDLLNLYDAPFYRLLYAKDGWGVVRDSINSSYGELTPYIYHKGNLQGIYSVFLDNDPIYLSTTSRAPLSIKRPPGKYNLKIRTEKYLYTIEELEITAGQKTFACLHVDSVYNNSGISYVELDSMPNMKAEWEAIQSNVLIAKFSGSRFYLTQDSLTSYISNNYSGANFYDKERGSYKTYGPFKQGNITVTDVQNDTTYSFYFQPGYYYHFSKDTSYIVEPLVRYPALKGRQPYTSSSWNFSQRAYSLPLVGAERKAFEEKKRKQQNRKQPTVYQHPLLKTHYAQGHHNKQNTQVQLINETSKGIRWWAVFNKEVDSASVILYNGYGKANNILPGSHDIVFFMNDSTYGQINGFQIDPMGLLMVRINDAYLHKASPEELKALEQRIIKINTPPIIKMKHHPQEIKGFTVNILPSHDGITRLKGEFYSEQGYPIIGARIYGEIAGYFKGGGITNTAGHFLLDTIPAGQYMFKMVMPNGRMYTIYNVTVPKGKTTHLIIEPEILFDMKEVIRYSGLADAANGTYQWGNDVVPVEDNEIVVSGGSAYNISDINKTTTLTSVSAESNITLTDYRDFEYLERSKDDFKSIEGIANLTVTESNRGDLSRYSMTVAGMMAGENNKGGNLDERDQERSRLTAVMDRLVQDQSLNRVRENFRDYGFWEPNLITDKDGKAAFVAHFPDNITRWKTIVPAMDGNKQTGIGTASSRSFKPLSANLGIPRFLVEGDTLQVLGKLLNYTDKTMSVKASFLMNGKPVLVQEKKVENVVLEKYQLSPEKVDTLAVGFTLQKADGYIDGENKPLLVNVNGIERSYSTLFELTNDTTLQFKKDLSLSGRTVFVSNSPLHLLKREMENLQKFKYDCNEQIASKLMALLLQQKMDYSSNEVFKSQKMAHECVKKLEKTQNSDGSWGWWGRSPGNTWITTYVLSAMNRASKGGFITRSHMKGAAYLKSKLSLMSLSEKLEALNVLNAIPYPMDYRKEMKVFEGKKLSLQDELLYLKLKQAKGDSVDLTRVLSSYEETEKGVFWGEELLNVKVNQLRTSLLAYEVIKKANYQSHLLPKVRNYFLHHKIHNRNTIQQATMIQTFIDDILKEKSWKDGVAGSITVNNRTLGDDYPYELNFQPDESIKIEKTGAALDVVVNEHKIEKNPVGTDSLFSISTKFIDPETGKEVKVFHEGTNITLDVQVIVQKSTEYVLVEVPIPASCSYGGQVPTKNYYETHRESFKNKTSIACTQLPIGVHHFKIPLTFRFEGSFHQLAPSVELMYFPEVASFGKPKKINVRPQK